MTATLRDIKGWIAEARRDGATHLIVACDSFDHENYPVFVKPGQSVSDEVARIRASSMQSVDEVYSFTGKYTVEEQTSMHRVFNLD